MEHASSQTESAPSLQYLDRFGEQPLLFGRRFWARRACACRPYRAPAIPLTAAQSIAPCSRRQSPRSIAIMRQICQLRRSRSYPQTVHPLEQFDLRIHRAFRAPVPIGCVPVLRRVLSPATRSRRSQPCRRSRQRRAYASALPIHCAGATLQCHRRSTSNAPRSDCPPGFEGTLRPAQARRARLRESPVRSHTWCSSSTGAGGRAHTAPRTPDHLRRLGGGDETAPLRHDRTATLEQIRSHVGDFRRPPCTYARGSVRQARAIRRSPCTRT